MVAGYRLTELTKLGGVLGVCSTEIIDFLVTEGSAVIDGEAALPEDE